MPMTVIDYDAILQKCIATLACAREATVTKPSFGMARSNSAEATSGTTYKACPRNCSLGKSAPSGQVYSLGFLPQPVLVQLLLVLGHIARPVVQVLVHLTRQKGFQR